MGAGLAAADGPLPILDTIAGTIIIGAGLYDLVNTYSKESKKSGKDRASDVPSWAEGEKPNDGESGKNFADRLLDGKHGKGNYSRGPSSDHSKLKKYGDRCK